MSACIHSKSTPCALFFQFISSLLHHSLSLFLFSLLVCLSSLLSVLLSLPSQTAVTVTWSCPRCVTSRRGSTNCRLKPSLPGRSYSLCTEASRMWVSMSTFTLTTALLSFTSLTNTFCSSCLSRSVPVGWLMKKHLSPFILSFFPKEVRHYNAIIDFLYLLH